MNGKSTQVWQWLAIFLSGVVVAGAPTMVRAILLPTDQEVKELQHEVAQTQLAVARLEERIVQLQVEVGELQAQVTALDNGQSGRR